MKDSSEPSISTVIVLLLDIAHGLEYLHSKAVIHGGLFQCHATESHSVAANSTRMWLDCACSESQRFRDYAGDLKPDNVMLKVDGSTLFGAVAKAR